MRRIRALLLTLALSVCLGAATQPPDWVPMRWEMTNVKSLDLLKGTVINCVLLPWRGESGTQMGLVASAAHAHGLTALALLRPGLSTVAESKAAIGLKFDGIVLEGDFAPGTADQVRSSLGASVTVVELGKRAGMRFASDAPVLGTYQGVWPGIHLTGDHGAAEASATGSSWIFTNSGFLRAARAFTESTIWVSVQPPANTSISTAQYLQAIGDCAMVGARWVLTLDRTFGADLEHGDESAVSGWKQICDALKFFESHRDWRTFQPLSRLVVIQGPKEGALLSGGVADMISASHTPLRIVSPEKLKSGSLAGSTVTLNVSPAALNSDQKQVLSQYARTGGTLFAAPAAWKKLTAMPPDQVALKQKDAQSLGSAWKDLESIIHRRLLGIRLFNVPAILFDLTENEKEDRLVLALTNYEDYPAENITIHLANKWHEVRLLEPGKAARRLETYPAEEGTGIDIDQIGPVAIVEAVQ